MGSNPIRVVELLIEYRLSSGNQHARVAQLVEYDLAKVGVAGSSPVSRFFICVESFEILIWKDLQKSSDVIVRSFLLPKISIGILRGQ